MSCTGRAIPLAYHPATKKKKRRNPSETEFAQQTRLPDVDGPHRPQLACGRKMMLRSFRRTDPIRKRRAFSTSPSIR